MNKVKNISPPISAGTKRAKNRNKNALGNVNQARTAAIESARMSPNCGYVGISGETKLISHSRVAAVSGLRISSYVRDATDRLPIIIHIYVNLVSLKREPSTRHNLGAVASISKV